MNCRRITVRRLAVAVAAVAAVAGPGSAHAGLTTLLTGPAWEIMLSDFGYSDYLGDLTPGFEGREYLSGEWGGAVGYQRNGSTKGPTWLEPDFIYPDWTTNSDFRVVTPMALGGLNAYGLPTASSVIANDALRITQDLQFVDTLTGIAMGNKAASAGGSGTSLSSNRYVLLQTYTFQNLSGERLSNLQFFQFLHGLTAQSGVYDHRAYGGAMAEYRYDVTFGGDAAGGAGQFDYISFHSRIAPSALELGHYGKESTDNHSTGKPSVGTHLSIEGNSLNGVDSFAPVERWVAGAQRFELGALEANQSVSFDIALTILTGYQVGRDDDSGSIGGGSGSTGGVDFTFEGEHDAGKFYLSFEREDADDLAELVSLGEIGPLSFAAPGPLLPLWELEYEGSFAGQLKLTFGYASDLLPEGLDPDRLHVFHWIDGEWQDLGGQFNVASGTIAIYTDSLSPFALGAVPVPEPGAWALLIGGLLVVGGRGRRQALRSPTPR